MSLESFILSLIVGPIYGWAAAYWHAENKQYAPKILHNQGINLLISIGALASIIVCGVMDETLLSSVISLVVIFITGTITNLKINKHIALTHSPASAPTKESMDMSVAATIIRLADNSAVRTRNVLNASKDRLDSVSMVYQIFCLIVLYKDLIDSNVNSIDAATKINPLIEEIVTKIALPPHQSKIKAQYEDAFENLAFRYKARNTPMSAKDASPNSIYSDFTDMVLTKFHIKTRNSSTIKEIHEVLDDILLSMGI